MLTESATVSRKQLQEMLNTHVCAECGGPLALFADSFSDHREVYIACSHFRLNGHDKIGKPNQVQNIEREARFNMVTQSNAVQNKLAKYEAATSLTTAQAEEIITTLWPEAAQASPAEVYKAKMLCIQYHLNPLANHVFLIPFDKYEGTGENRHKVGTTYATVLGIKANRLIASRKHHYTFLDDTPRIMTEEEQKKIYGRVQEDKIIFITKLKDLDTGAEASGRGEYKKENQWKKANDPKGTDKGNSMENMSAIRSERNAYDKLYPADMPNPEIPVIDETYENPTKITVVEPEKKEVAGELVEPLSEASESTTEVTAPETKPEHQEATDEVLPNGLNLTNLKEQLTEAQWSSTDVGKYLLAHFGVKGKKVSDMLGQLSKDQVAEFLNAVEERRGRE